MKKIVFPTDFSSAAENAFLYALSLSQTLSAELVLLHVYELPELGRSLKTTTKEVYEVMEMEALENFQKSVKHLRALGEEQTGNSVAFTSEMVRGETIYSITHYAKKNNADLIVMGTTGATGLKEVFLGSVASGVISESSCTVLSVPVEASFKTFTKVAYLTNYKKQEVDSFEKINEFAKFFNASVECVHYTEEETSFDVKERDNWLNLLGTKEVLHCEVITGSSMEHALVDYQKRASIDLVAVQPRKKSFLARLFSSSVTKTIAHHFHTPLLTLPKL